MGAVDLLLAAPDAQVWRVRRAIHHIARSQWPEAAALLALCARDTHGAAWARDVLSFVQSITR